MLQSALNFVLKNIGSSNNLKPLTMLTIGTRAWENIAPADFQDLMPITFYVVPEAPDVYVTPLHIISLFIDGDNIRSTLLFHTN